MEHLAPKRCFTRIGSDLTRKHLWLERLATDKHSSLLRKSVNYGHNKFYDADPWVISVTLYNVKYLSVIYSSFISSEQCLSESIESLQTCKVSCSC
jgi:hypothetical protein